MNARLGCNYLGMYLVVCSLVACDGDRSFAPGGAVRQDVAVVLNSVDISLTVFPLEYRGTTRTIGLSAAGSPVRAAVRDNLAVIPLGTFPAVAVVNLQTDQVQAVALPFNSGATGVAFLNDSIVYVTNPNLNTVTRINVRRLQATTEIVVGGFPQGVVTAGDRAFVLNAELDLNFQPARVGRISVIRDGDVIVSDTIRLSGFNPADGFLGTDGRLYIINSGRFANADGSLSVVDTTTLDEVEHHTGFGEFPGTIRFGPDGYLYVSSFSYGIAVWDAVGDTFIQSPSDPLLVDGNATSSGLGFDSSDRLYSLIPGNCVAPGRVLRVRADGSFERAITVGACPIAVGFGEVTR